MYAISPDQRNGIILCKHSGTAFIGPGAAVSQDLDPDLWGAIALGTLQLQTIETLAEQRQAYQRRTDWQRWLHRTIDNPDALHSALNLIAGLDAFFGSQLIRSLPLTVLADLAAVPVSTLLQACRFYYSLPEGDPLLPIPEGSMGGWINPTPAPASDRSRNTAAPDPHGDRAAADRPPADRPSTETGALTWSWLNPEDLGFSRWSASPSAPTPNIRHSILLAAYGFKSFRSPYQGRAPLTTSSWPSIHHKTRQTPYNLAKVI